MLDKDKELEYQLNNSNNGIYLLVSEGSVTVNGEKLERRDAIAIEDVESITITANSDSDFLLFELPE